jgi:tetratricopeptide (TPR) repeat protein
LSKYQEAKTIYDNSLSSLHLNRALAKINLGNVHFTTGNCQMALEEYGLALKFQESWLPAEHRYIARTLHNLSIVHAYQVNMNEANKYLERAQEIKNQIIAL